MANPTRKPSRRRDLAERGRMRSDRESPSAGDRPKQDNSAVHPDGVGESERETLERAQGGFRKSD
jgi:hypothetical protein